ncbi:hypothetical protein P4278_26975 [Bacillus thuringiensis]|nr:hypothetical protein [Bacillus thuringiensis]MED2783303.1 hypothetical protein [Bacillus thuringiensis]
MKCIAKNPVVQVQFIDVKEQKLLRLTACLPSKAAYLVVKYLGCLQPKWNMKL